MYMITWNAVYSALRAYYISCIYSYMRVYIYIYVCVYIYMCIYIRIYSHYIYMTGICIFSHYTRSTVYKPLTHTDIIIYNVYTCAIFIIFSMYILVWLNCMYINGKNIYFKNYIYCLHIFLNNMLEIRQDYKYKNHIYSS